MYVGMHLFCFSFVFLSNLTRVSGDYTLDTHALEKLLRACHVIVTASAAGTYHDTQTQTQTQT